MFKKLFQPSFVVCLLLACNLLMAASGTNENVSPDTYEVTCALPGPSSLTVVAYNNNSITVTWPQVPNAARYKVTAFDLDNNVLLSTTIIPVVSLSPIFHVVSGLPGGTNIEIGVSVSECLFGNEFGSVTSVQQRTDTIIVGDIVIVLPCNPGGGKPIIAGNSVSAFTIPVIQPQGADYGQGVLYLESTSGAAWSARINVAATKCPDDRLKFIYQEADVSGGLSFVEVQTSAQLQIKLGSTLLFTIQNFTYDAGSQGQTASLRCWITSHVSYASGRYADCSTCTLGSNPCTTGSEGGGHFNGGSEGRDNGAVAVAGVETTLSVNPNPLNDYATVQVNTPNVTPATITLYNAVGQIQRNIFNGDLAEGEQIFPLEMHDCAPGIYFITIQTESGRKITTVVKQ
jgi:Secretion system C-terminal sorting domain